MSLANQTVAHIIQRQVYRRKHSIRLNISPDHIRRRVSPLNTSQGTISQSTISQDTIKLGSINHIRSLVRIQLRSRSSIHKASPINRANTRHLLDIRQTRRHLIKAISQSLGRLSRGSSALRPLQMLCLSAHKRDRWIYCLAKPK